MFDNSQPEISVVIPCLNEALNVELIAKAVITQLDNAAASYEIIFIDNGSTDGTPDLVKVLCAGNERIRLIVNTRNFGQMRSPTYAIYQTRGRGVLGICADFQDPPEMIGNIVAKWRAGAPIVLAVRESERMSLILRLIRLIGYGIFKRFGDHQVIPGATGFGIYDRRVVDTLSRWRDPEPFFRGLLIESGFHVETIPYHRPPRQKGEGKNNTLSLISFGLSGLAGSAKGLLRVPLYLSIALVPVVIFTFITFCFEALTGTAGWPLIILLVMEIGFGLLFLFLGLIGEQVRIVSEMTRNVPLVVEKERVNFPELAPATQS